MARIGWWFPWTGLVAILAPARFALATMTPATPLAVPFLAQGELLCGGAAVAMVERWWGRRGVYAEDFAGLVRPTRGGILTTDLAEAARRRGYIVRTLAGGAAAAIQAIADSVPVIALIRVGADRYHFVVITAWRDAEVRFHDPAVGPDRRADAARFLEQWRAADAWMMVMVPGPAEPAAEGGQLGGPAAPMPCSPWLADAAATTTRGELDRADSLLARAHLACPGVPEVRRELAGLRFRQGRRAEAESLAIGYLAERPEDSLAIQLVATTRYLAGDRLGALDPWNAIGRPRVDLVRIDGSRRVRYRVLESMIDLPPRTVLHRATLARAQRRLAAVPGLSNARVDYVAVPGGEVEIRAAVVERPAMPGWPGLVVTNSATALGRRETGLELGSLTGAGERWQVSWRWDRADLSASLRLDVPVRVGLPGVASVRAARDAWRVDEATGTARRHTAELGWQAWVTPSLRGLVASRYERWGNGDRRLALTGGAELRLFDDRLTMDGTGEVALPIGTATPYRRGRVVARWESALAPQVARWSVRLGHDWASAGTPAGLLPHVGGDLGRAIPLRAHAWSEDGHMPDSRLARRITHGGAMVDGPLLTSGLIVVSMGGFADAAHAAGNAGTSTWLDVGVGFSIAMIGAPQSAVRIDLARGLLDQPGWGLRVGVAAPLARPLGIE